MNEVKSLQVLVIKLVSLLVGISSIGLLIALQGKALPYVLGLILGSAINVLLSKPNSQPSSALSRRLSWIQARRNFTWEVSTLSECPSWP